MRPSRNPWEGDAPENAQYPKSDNGENFIFWLAAAPFRAMAAPFRFVIGILAVRQIEDEIAKRGIWDDPDNPHSVDEVVSEYGDRFYRGNRRRKS